MTKKLLILLSSFIIIKSAEVKSPVLQERPLVIKVIEGKKVIAETVEGKELEAKLSEVRNKLDKEIKTLDAEIEKDVTDLRARARTVDAETLEKDQTRILSKKKQRDAKAESAQEEFSRTVNRELGKFNLKIQDTITETAEKNNWDIVSVKESGEIAYVSRRVNATDDIIKAHDSKNKKAKPAMPVNSAPISPVKK